ncbi:MAG: hypothetical protein K8W52_05710 [Deltaproteobacteria bacterium]|nr:hypothetical protein [Deltaproteobacteria bacterium]
MKKTLTSRDAKLALRKRTLKSLTSPALVVGGIPKTCPPDGTCVPGGSAGTSTGVACCTHGGRSR